MYYIFYKVNLLFYKSTSIIWHSVIWHQNVYINNISNLVSIILLNIGVHLNIILESQECDFQWLCVYNTLIYNLKRVFPVLNRCTIIIVAVKHILVVTQCWRKSV